MSSFREVKETGILYVFLKKQQIFCNLRLSHFIFVTLFFPIVVTLVPWFSLNLFPFWISVSLILPCSVQKVNKHDYVIFLNFCNFAVQNKKQKMEWKAHLEHCPIHNPWFLCQSDLTNFNCCISKLPSHLFCTQGVPASKFPISIWTRIQGQHGCQIFRKIV